MAPLNELQSSPADPHVGSALCQMRDLQVTCNRAETARARLTAELFQHFSADFDRRRAADSHFTATPLSETVTETQPVTGQTVGRIRSDLEAVLLMDEHLPWLAEYVDDGRLDLFRAKPVTDALKDELADHPEARRRFGLLMQRWFAKAAAASPQLLNKTITQVRNHVHYVLTKVLASEFDERFKKRYAGRRVTSQPTGDGMAALTLETDQVSVRQATHHLDLLARDARAKGDARSLEQLRADYAIDLLMGRQAADAGVGRWARPIINVTVPIQTLMGLTDEPGLMGSQSIPASLVRRLASDPSSTWYRMLTDPARQCAELSTSSYAPTGPIWRQVVASQPTCFAPACERPSAECELDHRVPWPHGSTSTDNLGPSCRRDHQAKHAPGASLRKSRDGTLCYTARSGMTHVIAASEQPVCDDPEAARIWHRLVERPPSCAELADALDVVEAHHRIIVDSGRLAERRAEVLANLRESYPDVPDEDIDSWVWDPDTQPPPVLRRTQDFWDSVPEEPGLTRLVG